MTPAYSDFPRNRRASDAQTPRPAPTVYSGLPRRARTYVVSTIGLGACVVLANIPGLLGSSLADAALFIQLLTLALLSSTVKVSLPLARSGSTMSLSYAISMAALLMTGTPQAIVINVASAWSQCTFNRKVKNPPFQTLFSMATVGIALEGAALVYGLVRGEPREFLTGVVRPLVPAVVTYFLLNSLLVAAAVALSTHQRLRSVWRANFLWSAPGYFVGGAAAALASLAAQQGNMWWGALVGIPLYLTYHSYRLFIGRIEDEQAQVRRMSEVQLATIEALTMAIEVKDQTSQDQIRRFQVYCEGLARSVGMGDDEIQGLKTAALLHDIGNLAVPEDILTKPGPLTEDEFQRVRIHPRVGAEILQSVPFPYPVAPLILAHHEHWDGSGYPSGLKGEMIPVGARILAVVDTFLAMLSHRPHRPATTREHALRTVRANAGRSLDPKLVERFVEILPSMDASLGVTDEVERLVIGSVRDNAPRALADIADAHREGKVLYEIAQALGSSLRVEETFVLIADKLSMLMPLSCAALFLPDRPRGLFRCAHAIGSGSGLVRRMPPATEEQLAIIPAEPDCGETPLRSALVVPLTFNDDIIGLLAVYQHAESAFTSEHRGVFERVAQRAAPVIFNALVFEEAQAASLADSLTGLLNRRGVQHHLEESLSRAREASSPVAVLLLDLDGLKYLNDNFGHHAGDRALRSVALALRAKLSAGELCARYAGDEFVIGLPGCSPADAHARLLHLQAAVDALTIDLGEGTSRPLAISAGAAVFPEDGATFDQLIAVADQRMYANKSARRAGGRTGLAKSLDLAS